MTKTTGLFCLGALACSGGSEPPLTLNQASEATLAGSMRARDGTPILDGRVTIGVADLGADPSGLFRFPEQLPGRLVVRTDNEAWTLASTGVELETGHTSATQLTSAPRVLDSRDLAGPVVLGGGDLSLTLPAGSLSLGGVAAVGVADFSFYRVVGPDLVAPGGRVWLRDDQYQEPFDAFAMIEVPLPRQGEERLDVVVPAVLAFTVGAGWPHEDQQDLGLYVYSEGDAWWLKVDSVEVIDGVITTNVNNFGWIAIGAQQVAFGCVSGTVQRDGAGVFGAEIRAEEAGRIGIDRVSTDIDGQFCVNTAPGGAVDLSVFGWGPLGDVVGTAQLPATGGGSGCSTRSSCTDVGVVDVFWVGDDDGDRYWPGQGDCNDDDPAINPIDSGDLCITE